MKLVSFIAEDRPSYGILTNGGIIDVGAELGPQYSTLRTVLNDLDRVRGFAGGKPTWSMDEVHLTAPVPNPKRILCVGLNYKTHIAETGRDTPAYPMLFPRYPESIVGAHNPLVRPTISEKFDYEGELAFVIGKGGRAIPKESALDHVAGYACFNDGSVRDFQRHTTQFLPGKNFWQSGSFGPCLVTPDEVGEVGNLSLVTRLNGVEVQRAKLDDLLFGVADLITYISLFLPLEPGDVVATGTTGGVGFFRDPPLWMKPGDTVEVEIDKVGLLRNAVVAEEDVSVT